MRGLPKVGILKAAAKIIRPKITLNSLLDKIRVIEVIEYIDVLG